MTTVAPNPHSPFADADPRYRHLFPAPAFLAVAPEPGVLTPTGCNRLAVVPDGVALAPRGSLPDGLCPQCVATTRADDLPPDERPAHPCTACGMTTRHEGLCALCRQEGHDEWWSTRDEAGSGAER